MAMACSCIFFSFLVGKRTLVDVLGKSDAGFVGAVAAEGGLRWEWRNVVHPRRIEVLINRRCYIICVQFPRRQFVYLYTNCRLGSWTTSVRKIGASFAASANR